MAPRPQSCHFWLARWRRLAGTAFIWRAKLSLAGVAARSIHDGPDTVDELLERHLLKKEKIQKGSDGEDKYQLDGSRLTSTRRESLSLYRDIIRATRFFSWPDARGVTWRDVLQSNARREFEEARFERDPETIARLLIGGRNAVESVLCKLADAQRKKILEEEEGRMRGTR